MLPYYLWSNYTLSLSVYYKKKLCTTHCLQKECFSRLKLIVKVNESQHIASFVVSGSIDEFSQVIMSKFIFAQYFFYRFCLVEKNVPHPIFTPPPSPLPQETNVLLETRTFTVNGFSYIQWNNLNTVFFSDLFVT